MLISKTAERIHTIEIDLLDDAIRADTTIEEAGKSSWLEYIKANLLIVVVLAFSLLVLIAFIVILRCCCHERCIQCLCSCLTPKVPIPLPMVLNPKNEFPNPTLLVPCFNEVGMFVFFN